MTSGPLILEDPFRKNHIVLMASSEPYFKLIEKAVLDLPNVQLIWSDDRIEAVAEIFIFKPKLIVVFCDTNDETLDFVRLVRNNPNYRQTPLFAVFTEPLKWKHKLNLGALVTERFETPINGQQFYTKARSAILGTVPSSKKA